MTIEYNLTVRTDSRNPWWGPPMTLSVVNRSGTRAVARMGVFVDGNFKKFYDQPIGGGGSATININQYIKAGSVSNVVYLCPGQHVLETPDRRRRINITIEAGNEGDVRSPIRCWDGSVTFREVYRSGKWVPTNETCPVKICSEGAKRGEETCWDGSVIHRQQCHNNAWISTMEMCPTMPAHGTKRNPTTCWDGSVIYTEKFDATLKRWVTTDKKCPPMPAHGAKRNPTTCWDGSVIYTEKFDVTLKRWVPTGEKCPAMPSHGTKRKPTTCWDGSVIHAEKFDVTLKRWVPTGEKCIPKPICTEGTKRSKETCWDGSTIYKEICRGNKWVPTGETCPPEPAAGEKRNPTTCWDGSVIHAEKFDVTLKRWIPTGEICPTKPECIPGDKKAGYVCKNGKWQAVPEPVVEPTAPTPEEAKKYLTLEEAVARHESGLPCYIKCTLPLFAMIPGLPWSPEMWVPPFCVYHRTVPTGGWIALCSMCRHRRARLAC